MAISTVYTYLMVKESSSYKKVMDITSFPDLGGDPEMLDATTMSDKVRVNVPGIQSLNSLNFDGFYKKTEFSTLKAMEGAEKEFAVWFGGTDAGDGTSTPTGSEGKFGFKGYASFYITGGNVNSLVGVRCAIANTTAPHLATT